MDGYTKCITRCLETLRTNTDTTNIIKQYKYNKCNETIQIQMRRNFKFRVLQREQYCHHCHNFTLIKSSNDLTILSINSAMTLHSRTGRG